MSISAEALPAGETVVYRYPPNRLTGDYIRSVFGVGVGVLITFYPDAITAVRIIFGAILVIFLFFAFKTIQRHIMRVAVNTEGIYTKAEKQRTIPWGKLEELKLRHYGTRRQVKEASGGFFQLTLKGAGEKLTFDSALEGFQDVAWHAAKALRENERSTDSVSAGHLLAFNVNVDEATDRPRVPGEGEVL